MKYVEQRTVDEVVQLHNLEPHLKTIYVEGVSDKLLIERFNEYKDINDVEVIEINSIDFRDEYNDAECPCELKYNCKNKVIYLSQKLESTIEDPCVLCIIDRDFDLLLNHNHENCFLKYTDYNSLELYCYNKNCLRNLFTRCIRWPDAPIEDIITNLGIILRYIFHLRFFLSQHSSIKYELIDNRKDISLKKGTGEIQINQDSYSTKALAKNGLQSKKIELVAYLSKKLSEECEMKHEIRGHDFIYYLFIYLEKIGKSLKLSQDVLDKIIWEYLDLKDLEKEQLFIYLSNKFAKSTHS